MGRLVLPRFCLAHLAARLASPASNRHPMVASQEAARSFSESLPALLLSGDSLSARGTWSECGTSSRDAQTLSEPWTVSPPASLLHTDVGSWDRQARGPPRPGIWTRRRTRLSPSLPLVCIYVYVCVCVCVCPVAPSPSDLTLPTVPSSSSGPQALDGLRAPSLLERPSFALSCMPEAPQQVDQPRSATCGSSGAC